jgi:Transglutaminase-like superfamily
MRFPQIGEMRALVRSGALMLVLPAMIRFLPVPSVLSAIEPGTKRRQRTPTVNVLTRMANVVSSKMPRFGVGECLTRSFLLYNLLRRFAYDPVFFIGGRLAEGSLECHSWIELDGKPLCEFNNPHMKFKVFYRYREREL